MASQESRPLLADERQTEREIHHDRITRSIKPMSLPKVQLGVLCFLRILDPMAFTQIFPYINEFITDLHVTNDLSQIGFYSGLVESSFALTQLLAIYPWGFFSDRVGRRPVVLAGVAGLSVTTLLFGTSTSFKTAILFRALAGLFSGNVIVIPTILCEITDETNQAFAFSFFGVWWPIGAIIGPLIGGLLAKPAMRHAKYFNYELFKTYPYILPCFLVSTIAGIAFIIACFFLNETLYMDSDQTLHGSPNSLNNSNPPTSKDFTLKQLFNIPIIRALCASGCALSFMSTAFDTLFVLFCFSPVSAGGLAFSISEIGFALSASGMIAALLQVFFMPAILRRVNHARMYHFCMKIWPFTFLSLPILNIIARHGMVSGTTQLDPFTILTLWACITVILCMTRVAFLAYSVNMLLVKKFAPNTSSLGSTTGMIQFCICFARAFSPTFASSAFAFSANRGFLASHFWAIFMASIGFSSSLFSRKIVTESLKSA